MLGNLYVSDGADTSADARERLRNAIQGQGLSIKMDNLGPHLARLSLDKAEKFIKDITEDVSKGADPLKYLFQMLTSEQDNGENSTPVIPVKPTDSIVGGQLRGNKAA